jgi:hypothetical protein
MDTQQEQTISIMEKDHRISPALLQNKLKVTHERAEQLCHWAWQLQARNAFYMRSWGLTAEEFERGDHLDG